MNNFYIDFEFFKELCTGLYDEIIQKNVDYKAVLCPLRGGFYISDFMSRKMKLPVFYLEISSYRKKERVDFLIGIKPKMEKGRYLLCDDIYDSGGTVNRIHNMYPDVEFDTVCIVSKVKNPGIVYGRFVEKEKWVDFFWESV